jgi:endonuclease/exonuclease/phosphatase family metal-dependent hydrolase
MNEEEEIYEGRRWNDKMRIIEWNISGYEGKKGNTKAFKIKNEINSYDVVVLTEVHLKEGEEDSFEKLIDKEGGYYFFHAVEKIKKKGGGVTIMVKKKLVGGDESRIEGEVDNKAGRWAKVAIQGILEEKIQIWGIYAPNNPTERKKWLRDMGGRMRKEEGIRVVIGDLNFVMDTRWDKVNGNKSKGTEGREEQREWERDMELVDVWRKDNEGIIGWTWREGAIRKKDSERIRMRIDRALIDERLITEGRICDVEIMKTNIPDHNPITVSIRMNRNKTSKKKSHTKRDYKR